MSIGEVTADPEMRKKRGPRSALLGLVLGFVGGFLVANFRLVIPLDKVRPSNDSFCPGAPSRHHQRVTLDYRAKLEPMDIVKLPKEDNVSNSATNLLFVGVMTARKYLDTRAKAVFETWGSELPGKIAFFSSETSTAPDNCPDLPLVALPNVDDSYPPQKKSFLMLQYMWQHFGDKFEWFLRADDDVYVRSDRLEKLLRSVDSRLPRYIGQAGRGNSEEFGLLSLEYDENFCMGGPGVVLSRETLKRVVPHIRYCLKNLYTTHEDVELGRCVQKYAGIPCTWSYEQMQSILYHNSSGDQAFTGNLKRKEVHRAITLHPVKSPPYMYRLHNYMRGLRIQELQHLKVQLHRDIQSMMAELHVDREKIQEYSLSKNVPLFPEKPGSDQYLGDNKVLGVPAGLRAFRPKKTSEVIPWDFLSKSEYSLTDANPRRRIHSDVKEGLEDITREVMASINACSRQRGRVVEERSILYGYRRVDAYGADTVLDILLVYRKYRGRKVTLPVRRHVYVHQHFTGLEIREVVDGVEAESKTHRDREANSIQSVLRNSFLSMNFNAKESFDPIESKVIHFILPLSGRLATFRRFISVYEDVCLVGKGERTELTIILFPHRVEGSFNESTSLVNNLKYKYPSAVIAVVPSYKNFSRAVALEIGVSRHKDDDLLFFVDVDIVFTSSALRRIRLNTIMNRQVYFPIVFSQFDPKIVYADGKLRETDLITNSNGYWREYGFGIASLYKKDFRLVGGFDLSIQGWGKEDVDLFEKAVRSNLTTFRAVDPHLVHVFHDVECDPSLSGPQLTMCEGSRADTYAGLNQLADTIYGHPEYLRYAKALRTRTSTPAA
ncbi:chondroitin sulfate synthase 1 isoform X2 [Neodiprion fabricii]|uniref:chondroitin sulfate synthase 1 isoform X2 n=1 Tax=Neodiprion fabricii TaxID=2872261 RepID=UPI001ED91A36|nr:chondroitin sulfate synthase 1 isoform X2 [Neodiprion fabricii]